MSKIKLLLSYDGTEFQGWQRQPGTATVQGTVENVLTQIYNEPVKVVGSGRTDAGTHAVGQVAHFVAPKPFKGEDRFVRAINSLLNPTLDLASPSRGRMLAAFNAACLQAHLACWQEQRVP